MGSFVLTLICPWRSFYADARASESAPDEAFSDRSRLVRTRHEYSRFIRIAGLFPNAFAVWIARRERFSEAQAGVENVMGRPAVESEGEAEIAVPSTAKTSAIGIPGCMCFRRPSYRFSAWASPSATHYRVAASGASSLK
jgi:hypothetical protein